MLKKLQLKFIAITMVFVTAMLCTIFGMLYHFTKTDLEMKTTTIMKSIADSPAGTGRPGMHVEDVPLPYFSVRLGNRGEILSTSGYYDLSDTEFLSNLVQAALHFDGHTGVLEQYDLRFYQSNSHLGRNLVFVDMSSELATLKSLVQTSLFIGIISFVAFLCISVFLAKWAIQPVEKAWKQQQQFVSDASHELKTPLTVIMANAELLEAADSEENRVQYTDNILTMSRQMRHLLEQMLTLARADNGQSNMAFAPVDFSQVIADAVLPFEPVFFEKGLALTYSITPGIRVNGEKTQLRQVVDILLDNAQKYAGGKTWVTLQMSTRSRCILTVANEGALIPPEQLENLFKRFYRQDAARSRDGSFGLGLSIAENIIKRHKGKIWADSRDGINRFHTELPTT